MLWTGFVHSLEFLKKSRNLASNFLDLEKVWKNGKKKMAKSFISAFFYFRLGQIFNIELRLL